MARKTKAQKQQEQRVKLILGTIIFVFSILIAIAKIGFLGVLLANLLRFLVGSTYVVLSFLLISGAIYYCFNFGKKGRRAREKTTPALAKFNLIGLIPLYLGVILLWSIRLFAENKPKSIVKTTMSLWWQDFSHVKNSNFLGGGFVGSCFYTITNFLVSKIGSLFIAILLIIVGIYLLLPIDLDSMKHFGNKIKKFITDQTDHEPLENDHNHLHHKNNFQKKAKNSVRSLTPGEILAENEKDVFVNQEELVPEQMELPVITSFQDHHEKDLNHDHQQNEQDKELELAISEEVENLDYSLPSPSLFTKIPIPDQSSEHRQAETNVIKLEKAFASFGIEIKVVGVSIGPAVTKYEIKPPVGVKVSKITGLTDDIALALAAKDIRIEAPIPGKSAIGIEIPNLQISTVSLRDIIENAPKNPEALLEVPLGRDVLGQIQVMNLEKMPHLLIAGSTGSGKSVAVNCVIASILMRAKPNEVKFVMVDPKMVELSVYNGIPHLLTPVVTNPRKAAQALNKVVEEMERRYELFANFNVRKIASYNEMVQRENLENGENHPTLPLIVVIVDELSDLMMVASTDVENAIIRLGQKARAAGIHVILATQRPSVDVVSGLIKANVPSRIAFAVSSGTDSRTIIDINGAERLLGRGDMLYKPLGANHPIRVQGAFVSDRDVEKLVNFVKNQQEVQYNQQFDPGEVNSDSATKKVDHDEYFEAAKQLVIEEQTASASMIQRRFRTGYNRALRIVEELEDAGIIGPSVGTKPREVLISQQEELET